MNTAEDEYPPDDMDDSYYDAELEEDEFEEFDCHMGPDGLCGSAGSEECDFECPYRDEMYKELERKARRKDK